MAHPQLPGRRAAPGYAPAGRPALTAVNLASDMAMITTVGNDIGFGHIFLRQPIALARPGDGVIGFSTSGSSENILTVFAKARQLGVVTMSCGVSAETGEGMQDWCHWLTNARTRRPAA